MRGEYAQVDTKQKGSSHVNSERNPFLRRNLYPDACLTGWRLWSSLAAVAATAKLTDTLIKQPRGSLDRRLDPLTYRAKYPLLNKIMSLVSGAGEPWALYPVSRLLAVRWASQGQ